MERWRFCAVLISIFSSGCAHQGYLWQAFRGQMAIFNRQVPIDEVIQNPSMPRKTKEKLQLVKEIKKFAEIEMGVKPTTNYSKYVDLKRPHVVWVVSVADQFELNQKTWSFPLVGEVPYLGYFKEKGALDFAKDMEEEGYDVSVGGVDAYSSLGYFQDPLLSTMIDSSDGSIANLIFHETTHRYIYVSGDGHFNESAASFIGELGEKVYLENKYGKDSNAIKSWEDTKQRRRKYAKSVKEFADSLKVFYSQLKFKNLSKEKMDSAKYERFRNFQESAVDENEKRFRSQFKNNASLLSYLNYEDNQEFFDLIAEKSKGHVRHALECLKRYVEQNQHLRGNLMGEKGRASLPAHCD